MNEHNTKGFTLIELLIGLLLVSIIIPSIFVVYNSSHKCYLMQESITEMHQNARATIELMTRELRDAFMCQLIDSNTLAFYADNPNAVVGISSGNNTRKTLNDDTKSWDPNIWDNKLVAITSGAGANEVKRVVSHTDKQLSISDATDPNWAQIPNDTSVYHLDVAQKEFSWSSITNMISFNDGIGSHTATAFSDNITNLTFSMNQTTGKIEIQLTARTDMKDPKNDQYHTYSLTSTVKTRNI
ncbi:MAG: PilW family protein [bacterium]